MLIFLDLTLELAIFFSLPFFFAFRNRYTNSLFPFIGYYPIFSFIIFLYINPSKSEKQGFLGGRKQGDREVRKDKCAALSSGG
jgi:hypothetical protein